MAERDPRSSDPDDWFADPGRAPSRRARQAADTGADDDDWIAGNPRSRRARPTFVASLPDNWVPLAGAAALAVVFLVAVLAVFGVFSSSAKQITPVAPVTTTQVTSPTTTQAVVPPVSAPATTLKPGDTGVQVKRLQRALAQLGYSVGKVDGDYGASTKTALAQFQTASKLTADGLFGTATRTALIKALRSG